MAFRAILERTGESVHVFEHAHPKIAWAGERFACPAPSCGSAMRIAHGRYRRYFFHYGARCRSHFAVVESAEHLAAKERLMRTLPLTVAEYADAVAEPEVWHVDPATGREVGRSDVVFALADGRCIAHEVQLSTIDPEELTRRTAVYERFVDRVYWWLGNAADTPSNRMWCLRHQGVELYVEYEYKHNPCDALREPTDGDGAPERAPQRAIL